MFSVKIESITVVRAKRLSDKRSVSRNAVNIKAVDTSVKTVDGGLELTVDFNHPKIEGVLLGKLDLVTCVLKMNTDNLQLKGYLKSRGFKVIGYELSASQVNTNERKREV